MLQVSELTKTLRIPLPVIDKLLPIYQPARFKVLYGGRASGKSICIADFLISKTAFSKKFVLCCREFQSSMLDSVLGTIAMRIEALGLESRFTIYKDRITSKSGSTFIFKGLERGSVVGLKSIPIIDYCWIEEAESVSINTWEKLRPTVLTRTEKPEILVSFNPEAEENATYQMFVVNPDPDWVVIKINYNENPYLTESAKIEIEHIRKHYPDRFKHIYEGECSRMSNAVIFGDKYEVRDFELTEIQGRMYYDNKIVTFKYGMDYGFSIDPTAMVESFAYRGDLYIVSESYNYKLDTDDIISVMKEKIPRGLSKHWFGDGARPETISQLSRPRTHRDGHALPAINIEKAIKGAGSVEEGIVYLRNFNKIIVHPRCKNILYELKNYKYKQDPKTGEIFAIPVDKDNHLIDALRYSYNEEIQALKGGRISKNAVEAVRKTLQARRWK